MQISTQFFKKSHFLRVFFVSMLLIDNFTENSWDWTLNSELLYRFIPRYLKIDTSYAKQFFFEVMLPPKQKV